MLVTSDAWPQSIKTTLGPFYHLCHLNSPKTLLSPPHLIHIGIHSRHLVLPRLFSTNTGRLDRVSIPHTPSEAGGGATESCSRAAWLKWIYENKQLFKPRLFTDNLLTIQLFILRQRPSPSHKHMNSNKTLGIVKDSNTHITLWSWTHQLPPESICAVESMHAVCSKFTKGPVMQICDHTDPNKSSGKKSRSEPLMRSAALLNISAVYEV